LYLKKEERKERKKKEIEKENKNKDVMGLTNMEYERVP
jgi:hypothetical protein